MFKARLAWKESDLAMANQKIGEALNLLTQFQSYVRQLGEIMTKAQIYDETVAKTLPVTEAKVINIVVDYNSKMDMLLIDMQKLMADLHPAALPPGPIDLLDFPEIPAAEIPPRPLYSDQGCRNQDRSPRLPVDPGSDAWTRPTNEPLIPSQDLKFRLDRRSSQALR